MPFLPVKKDKEYSPGTAGITERLKDQLPGMTDEYYADQTERILQTALSGGYNIASVIDSFIIGASLRGDKDDEQR